MTASPEPGAGARPARVLAVVGVGVLVVLGLVVALLVVGGGSGSPDAAPTSAPSSSTSAPDDRATRRTDAIALSTAFVQAFNTIGPSDLAADGSVPAYRERLAALVTPRLATSLDSTLQVVQEVAARGFTTTGVVNVVGVQSLGDASATTVVSGTTTRTGAGADPTPTSLRTVLTLTHGDDGWLVDDVQAVTRRPGPLELVGVERPAVAAGAAAVAALPQVLGYDYRTMAADLDAAGDLMSPTFRRQFDALGAKLTTQARRARVVVAVRDLQVGLAAYDGDTADVLVIATQRIERAGTTIAPALIATVVRMRLLDGQWYVDGLPSG